MQTVIIDFDGVINSYKKWTGDADLPDPPVEGALDAILQYDRAGLKIHIMSTRAKNQEGRSAIDRYLVDMGVPMEVMSRISISDQKVPAILTIDARAFHFHGYFPAVETIQNFKPWNRKWNIKL